MVKVQIPNMYSITGVPRYFEPFVNDCFHNAYGAVVSYMGLNPQLVLADYLSFMYDPETAYIGVNYLYRHSTSVQFSEEELNTSLEFVYQPETKYFDPVTGGSPVRYPDKLQINMYISDDPIVADSRLKQLIAGNKPVIAVVDLHYMRYHRAYQKEHGLHAVIITGYNEEEGCYELFDKYRLSSSDFDGKLPMDEIKAGRMSDNPLSNAMIGDYKRHIRNLWMELDCGPEFKVTKEKVSAVLVESSRRMRGEKLVLGRKCGFERLEAFRGDLRSKKASSLDDYHLYLFKTYYNTNFKSVARNRLRFRAFINETKDYFTRDTADSVSELLLESAKHWDIAANVSLKLGVAKKLELIDDLDRQFQSIIEIEKRAIDRLGGMVSAQD